MLTGRLSVANPVNRTRQTMDRLFDTMLSELGAVPARQPQAQFFPALNIWEDQQALHVEAELPGFAMEQIDVSLVQDQLTISGSRTVEQPDGGTFLRRERPAGEFSRTIGIPTEFDGEKVEATLRDGVLHIALPKAETAMPRRIEVKAAT